MSTVARTIDEFGAGVRAGAVAAVQVRAWAIVVWSTMAGWSIVLFAIAYDQFLNYQYSRFDLGNMTQAVWSTTQGRPLEMTDAVTGEQVVRLAYHVDPILVLLTPIWIVLPSPLTLVGVQIAACALGALPIFWLARRHLQSEAVAALLALVYLAYPWLAWNALDAIHPVTLAIPLFLFALWFLDTDRMWAFAGCAVLAAMCGELMGIPLAGLGVWYALARGRRRQGAVIAAARGGLDALLRLCRGPALRGWSERLLRPLLRSRRLTGRRGPYGDPRSWSDRIQPHDRSGHRIRRGRGAFIVACSSSLQALSQSPRHCSSSMA